MGRIPLYQSKEQLSVISPQAVRESPQAAGQMGRDLQVAGNAVTEAHDTIRKAYDWQQVGSAKLKTLEGMTALETKALQDGDNTGDFSQYDGEFQRLKTETLKGISNPSVKAKFAMDFDLQAAQTKTQISAQFRKNMVNKGIADLGTMNEYFTNEYAKTGDPSYIENMGKNIDAYVSKGFIAADDAQKLKTANTLKAKDAQFIFDKESNPALAQEKLKANTYGFDTVTLAKANDVFDREIKIVRNENEDALMQKYVNGTLTSTNEVKTLMNEGKIDGNFAASMIKAMQSPDRIAARTESKVFNNIAEVMINVNKKPADIRLEMLQKNATGELNDEDFNILNTFNQSITKDVVDKAMPKRIWLQRLFNNGQDLGIRQEVVSDMFKQYIQKVNAGEDPAKAVSTITSMALDQHLSEQLNRSNTQYAINPETKQRIHSEDGGATWLNEKGEVIK